MADIFLSYASEDRNRVRPLAEALESRGFSVWWDRALGAGEDYSAVITRELQAARAVIVVWTQAAAASTFVRDEAGRARDERRLVPVLFDKVEIPLGFGAFQAEDFTAWNGRPEAAQIQILEEALRAKLEGRDIDGGAVAAKRRRLMGRIRLVSLLTVIAALVGIAAGLNNIFNPSEPEIVQTDLRAELLRLLSEGKLTPEQAIQLAQILEQGALGEAPGEEVAMSDADTEAAPMDSAGSGAPARSAQAGAQAQLASVSSAEFDAAARETYRDAMAQLLVHPDAQVRRSALELSNDDTRDAAMQQLWAYAEANPASAAAIYRVCGAVGERSGNPLGQRALENAAAINPQDRETWRMLSYSYDRAERPAQAQAAALVGEGVAAQAQGQTEVAEQRLEAALPNLETPAMRAYVSAELGDLAEQRRDWGAATERYADAYRAREQAIEQAPAQGPVSATLQVDAQKLVRALDRSGRTREACEQLRQAQTEHGVEAPDADLVRRCETLRVQIRPQVLQRPPVQLAPRAAE